MPANWPSCCELAELLRIVTDEVMQYIPGFVSANIHLGTDNT